MNRPLNHEKLKAEVLYVLQQTGQTDFHKLFKILYFADMMHLKEHGRPIVTNDYVAMKNGPVPSTLYDILKGIKFDTYNAFLPNWREDVDVNEYFVTAIKDPDLDELSENDIITLDHVIEWAMPLSMTELTEKSHGPAYMAALEYRRKNIDIYEIAKEGGASEQQITQMKERDEVYSILSRPLTKHVCTTCSPC